MYRCSFTPSKVIAHVGKVDDGGKGEAATIPRSMPMMVKKRSLAEDLDVARDSHHVVIVMDPLRQFSTKPLEWALRHVVKPGCMLTLLGVMPWLNLALSCKTWLNIWSLNLADVTTLRERSERKSDAQFQNLRAIAELCEAHGVVPLMKVVMGHPVRLVVLEQTSNLRATWVVFDRHQKKRRRFYRKRIPCNMVMMNADEQVDMLKVRPMLDGGETNTPGDSPALAPPAPKLIISKEWMEILNKDPKREAERA